MATAAIVGAGYMGSAMAWPLSDNGHTIRLVGTHLDGDIIKSCKEQGFHPKLKRQLPERVTPFYIEEIAQALEGVDIIVSGVNSLGAHWIGRTIGPYVRPGQLIIAITKGLEAAENGDLILLPDVLAAELPAGVRDQVKIAAVGGPCIAGELAGRRQTTVVFGSRHQDALEQLAAVFRTPYYHVWTTTDLAGLEVCAALKNAFTVGVGIAAGLLEKMGGVDSAGAHMHNQAAGTFAQACTEMDRVLQIVGGTRAFAYGLPGAGDLYVTCMGGRTIRLGRLLGLGHTWPEARAMLAGETLEGAEIIRVMNEALPKLVARGIVGAEEFPLLRALGDVIVRGMPVNIPLDAFFLNSAPNLWHQPSK